MVTLCRLLRDNHGIFPYVILPRKGNGYDLLRSNKIMHSTIKSYDWVMALGEHKNIKFNTRKLVKQLINGLAAYKIARFAKREKFTIIHINTTYSYVGSIAAKWAKIPCVWHLREFLEEDQSKTLWNRKRGYALINKSTKIVAISQSIYNKYQNVFDSNKLVMIHNGIDIEKFYNPNKEIFESDKVIFIFVGGFADYKGHPEFAQACVKVAEQGFQNFDIWFVGTGNAKVREEVLAYLADHGLSDHVQYLGYQRDVEKLFAQSDISFTCSKSEAFGRITVEAMLAGNLLIGADSAGTQELISHMETGLLYAKGNPDDLAEKIMFAMNNKFVSKQIAANGRKYMSENMTAQINAENVAALYKKIIL